MTPSVCLHILGNCAAVCVCMGVSVHVGAYVPELIQAMQFYAMQHYGIKCLCLCETHPGSEITLYASLCRLIAVTCLAAGCCSNAIPMTPAMKST